jgi:hypothetical protein
MILVEGFVDLTVSNYGICFVDHFIFSGWMEVLRNQNAWVKEFSQNVVVCHANRHEER